MLAENIGGKPFNKFPGGGVELGEGIADALIREFKEELNLDVVLLGHIYTTDFFVRSAFYPEYQVIAVYYRVKCADLSQLRVLDTEIETVSWLKKESASQELISLETDRIAFNWFIGNAGLVD